MVGRKMEERDLKKSGGSGQGKGYRLGFEWRKWGSVAGYGGRLRKGEERAGVD